MQTVGVYYEVSTKFLYSEKAKQSRYRPGVAQSVPWS
jgi:hypothetical protein